MKEQTNYSQNYSQAESQPSSPSPLLPLSLLSQIEKKSISLYSTFNNLKNCIKEEKKCQNKKCLKSYQKIFNKNLFQEDSLNLNKYLFLKHFFQNNKACHSYKCHSYAKNLFQIIKEGFKLFENPLFKKEILIPTLNKIKKHASFNEFKKNLPSASKDNFILDDLIHEGYLGIFNAFLRFDFKKKRLSANDKVYNHFLNYTKKFAYKYMLVYVLKNFSFFSISQSTFQKLVSQKQINKYEHMLSLDSLLSENKKETDDKLNYLANAIDKTHPIFENSFENSPEKQLMQKETNMLLHSFLKKILSQLSPKEEFYVRAKIENTPLPQKEKKQQNLAFYKFKKNIQKNIQKLEQIKSLIA